MPRTRSSGRVGGDHEPGALRATDRLHRLGFLHDRGSRCRGGLHRHARRGLLAAQPLGLRARRDGRLRPGHRVQYRAVRRRNRAGAVHGCPRRAAAHAPGVVLRPGRCRGWRFGRPRGRLPDEQPHDSHRLRARFLRPGLDCRRARVFRHLAPARSALLALAAGAGCPDRGRVPAVPVRLHPVPVHGHGQRSTGHQRGDRARVARPDRHHGLGARRIGDMVE